MNLEPGVPQLQDATLNLADAPWEREGRRRYLCESLRGSTGGGVEKKQRRSRVVEGDWTKVLYCNKPLPVSAKWKLKTRNLVNYFRPD